MSTYRVPQVLTALRPAAQEQRAGPYSPGVWQAARCGSSVNCPLSFLPESVSPLCPGSWAWPHVWRSAARLTLWCPGVRWAGLVPPQVVHFLGLRPVVALSGTES